MGWGREGLKAMAELRAYTSSGGKIKLKHLKLLSRNTYSLNKANKARMHKMYAKTQEQFKNVTILNQGKVIPMFWCLKGMQNGRLNSKDQN